MEDDERQKKENDKYLESVRLRKDIGDDVKRLVAEDLEFGLTKDQVETYLNKSYNMKQMRAISDCCKRDYPKDVIAFIKTLNADKMTIAVEYYEKGVTLPDIIKAVNESPNAKTMQSNIHLIYEKMHENEKQMQEQPEYVKQVLDTVSSVVQRVDEQNERYEEYQKKLEEQQKKEEERYNELLKNLSNKDKLLQNQSKQLSEANQKIETLHKEKEELEKQMGTVSMVKEKKDFEKASEPMKVDEPEKAVGNLKASEPVEVAEYPVTGSDAVVLRSNFVKEGKGVKVERIVKKNNAAAEIVNRLFSKKKSTYNFIKLITEKKLSVAQISQIKLAMMKELDEDVLYLLVNPEMDVDTMAELIDFATLAKEKRLQRKRG